VAINSILSLDAQRQLKSNQFEGYQKAIHEETGQQTATKVVQHAGIKWSVSRSKEDGVKINPILETDHVILTSVRKTDSNAAASMVAHKLGYNISLDQKKDVLIEKYLKNFIQAKSHNYIVSKFAQLKSSFLAQLLSNIGVTIPELQKMQKKALQGATDENELLFEENEYNAEMICALGGSGKKLKKELQIMDEIRTQLMTQMTNLGKPDYYNDERQLLMKIKVCKRIYDEFKKEKDLLEYERDLNYLNADGVKTREDDVFSRIASS
jgi:C4-dicarboxylate-specific signal transduction histidine kinase